MAAVRRHIDRHRGKLLCRSRCQSLVPRLTSDLKAMLGADGKVSGATGNHFDLDDMTGQGPMGYFCSRLCQ
jgi:hypothetical protein